MNKKLLTAIIGTSLILGACGDESTEEATKENVQTEEAVSIEEAKVGDIVVDEDYGEYEVLKVANPVESAETADVSVSLSKVLLATFTPSVPDMFGGETELPVVVTLISAENGADGEVTFSPFNGNVDGNEAVMGLNSGESSITPGSQQDFVTAYHADSTDISSTDIFIKSPSQNALSIGDDVEFTVTFE